MNVTPADREFGGRGNSQATCRLWTLVVLAWGCQEPAVVDAPAVLSERQLAVAAVATKAVGEECGGAGASECTTGLCLHTGPERERGHFCSRACQAVADCPERWWCKPLLPGEATRVCIPPEGWVSAAVGHTRRN